jgi:hypothetical protein
MPELEDDDETVNCPRCLGDGFWYDADVEHDEQVEGDTPKARITECHVCEGSGQATVAKAFAFSLEL